MTGSLPHDLRAQLDCMDLRAAKLKTVAHALGMGREGLRKRLQRAGLSFMDELYAARRNRFIAAWAAYPNREASYYTPKCGYWNANEFRKMFPRFMGMSWSEWRERHEN